MVMQSWWRLRVGGSCWRRKNVNREAQRQAARAALALLCQRWPKCFNPDDPRPLKIGIAHDLTRELGEAALRPELKAALNLYCGNVGYLSTLRAGRSRLDLQGNEVGVVSREDELRAAARLKGFKTAKVEVKEAKAPLAEGNPTPQRRGDSFEDLRRAARERKQAKQSSR
jgi:ProP effector